MLRAKAKVQQGFSLIEVMMATTILLVGFVGMIQAVTIGSESLDTARKQQIANQIVAAELERLRSGTWSAVADLPASASIAITSSGAITGNTNQFALSSHTSTQSDDNTDLSALAAGFTCAFTREYLRPTSASASTATYLKLVYTVTWTTNTGHVQTHKVATFLGKNGLHLSYQQS